MKQDINKYLDIIRENEQILQGFFEIEKIILRIHTFNDLVSTLLNKLKSRFNVQYVGITFFKGKISTDGLNIESLIDKKNELCKLVSGHPQTKLFLKSARPILDDKNFDKWKKFFPPEIIKTAGSISVTPLQLNQKIIGCLNLADSSKTRYKPNRETIFLERLAAAISICIDNVIKYEQLKHLSNTDSLTGLANRREVNLFLEKELRRSLRDGSKISLLFIDLDDFKKINDSYGHDVGDLYLKHVAKILVKECRDFDCVSRFGGDEFVVVLCRANRKAALSTLERIQKSLSQNLFQHNDIRIRVMASIGLASTDKTKYDSAEKFLKAADQKLYKEKKIRKVKNTSK